MLFNYDKLIKVIILFYKQTYLTNFTLPFDTMENKDNSKRGNDNHVDNIDDLLNDVNEEHKNPQQIADDYESPQSDTNEVP